MRRLGSRRQVSENSPADSNASFSSGIFGYVNYLVEKDRKFILDTLINGTFEMARRPCPHHPVAVSSKPIPFSRTP